MSTPSKPYFSGYTTTLHNNILAQIDVRPLYKIYCASIIISKVPVAFFIIDWRALINHWI